jgi:hypothetical protein
MAEQLSLFSIVTGVALLLSGVGFIVLALAGAALPVVSGAPTQIPHRQLSRGDVELIAEGTATLARIGESIVAELRHREHH